MTSKARSFLVILLLGGLGAAGYGRYRGRVRRAAVLARITALETAVAADNKTMASEMTTTVRTIGYYTCLNRNLVRDAHLRLASKQIQARTQSLTDTLHALQRQLRVASGERAGGPLRAPNQDVSIDIGTSALLLKHLGRYANFLQPPSSPLPRPTAGISDTAWVKSFFSKRWPLSATVAALTQLEALVQREGASALQFQAGQSGRIVDWYDTVKALAVAESETVAPGAVYKARLFLIDTRLHYCLMTSANGQPFESSSQITFLVPSQPPTGPAIVRAQWQGIIQALAYPEVKPYAADSTWQLDVPYFIVKRSTP
jgi:hypothetical protein